MRFRTPAVLAVFLLFLTLRCTGPIEVGPITVVIPATAGSFTSDLLSLKQGVPVTTMEEICTLPSEEELEGLVAQVGEIDLSRFARLSRLELNETVMTATEGSFDFISRISLRYVPVDTGGEGGETVVLGTAQAPEGGFGQEIVIPRSQRVDFLDLIRQNDTVESSECPTLEIELTVTGVPTQDVMYESDVVIDAFAEIGRQ